MENRPRYYFAHQVMRNVVFKAGKSLEDMIVNNQGKFEWMIMESWKFASKMFEKPVGTYNPEIDIRKLDEQRSIVLFSCPKPRRMLDAYMCGVVIGGEHIRYFTVEKGMERTILGEWTRGRGHLNYGEVGISKDEVVSKITDVYDDIDPEAFLLNINKGWNLFEERAD